VYIAFPDELPELKYNKVKPATRVAAPTQIANLEFLLNLDIFEFKRFSL